MLVNKLIKLPEVPSEMTIRKNWFGVRNDLIAETLKLGKINSKSGFFKGAELLKRLTSLGNELESLRKKLGQPFNQAAKIIKKTADEALEPLEARKNELREQLNQYAETYQEQKQSRDSEVLEEIERHKKEQENLNRIAQDEFDSETEILEPEIFSEAEDLKSDFVSIKSRIKFETVDQLEIPRAFLSVDTRKIQTWINKHNQEIREAFKENTQYAEMMIPGLKLELKTEVSAR
jgi:hypothetical protein